jgi:hypothetical protein
MFIACKRSMERRRVRRTAVRTAGWCAGRQGSQSEGDKRIARPKADPENFQSLGELKCHKKIYIHIYKNKHQIWKKNTFNQSFQVYKDDTVHKEHNSTCVCSSVLNKWLSIFNNGGRQNIVLRLHKLTTKAHPKTCSNAPKRLYTTR